MKRFTEILVVLLIIGFPALSAGEGSTETISAAPPVNSDIPVKAVTLYSAGLAQIVHETTVSGDEVLYLPVEYGDVNDVLKSLRVEDLDGGRVDAVNFTSGNPLSSVLSDLRVDPSGSPGITAFLRRTQGEAVRVSTPEGVFSGAIFSVEESSAADGEIRTVLNLMTSGGLESVDISRLERLTFADSDLQAELSAAMGEIARARIKSSRLLKISLKGEGERIIRLSYIRAVPLWKTSYRIMVASDGGARLEGWALVQNTGSEAWKDVQLSFVAGSPNAFQMDLESPLYVQRETVAVPGAAPVGAVVYESGTQSKNYMRSVAPSMAYESEMMAEYDDFAMEEVYEPAPMEAAASGQRSGNYYRYTVSSPVTVDARSSAMIPIMSSEGAGETLAVYDPASGGMVFKSIRLENSADAHWAAGPASVSEGNYYAGDALIPDMIPGSRRFISYALHGSLEVKKSEESLPRRIVALKIVDGVLQRSEKMEKETLYRITGTERELILIHPKQQGWTLTESPEIDEETPSAYRFTLESWDDKPVKVSEEYILSREYGLYQMSLSDLAWYLEQGDLSREMKSAFEKISALKSRVQQLSSDSQALSSRISRLERDQSRVRDNMGVLESSSELYKKYSEQLAGQEDEIQSLNRQVESKEASRLSAERELRSYINTLNL